MGKLFGYSETDKHKIYTILGIKTSLKKKSTQNNTCEVIATGCIMWVQ